MGTKIGIPKKTNLSIAEIFEKIENSVFFEVRSPNTIFSVFRSAQSEIKVTFNLFWIEVIIKGERYKICYIYTERLLRILKPELYQNIPFNPRTGISDNSFTLF